MPRACQHFAETLPRGMPAVLGAAVAILAWLASAVAAGPVDEPQFERDVAPLLEARCVKCHRKQKLSGRLDLSTAQGLGRGGQSGAVLDPGDPDASLLVELIEADEMPPEPEARLLGEEKALVRRWIAQGAEGVALDPTGGHWSYRPLARPDVPSAARTEQVANPIDAFVLDRLEGRGLRLAEEADRPTLIRRVSFDLLGLPPAPDEIAAFLADGEPGAYQRMVERCLASLHYGQRWGKYWLDAAGYADSNGYFNADSDRPLAYKYRDYVIAAHNADKPFDRFVLEQLAGDELVGYVPGGDVTPEMVEPLIATHFLRNSQDGTGESDGNDDEQLVDRFTVLEGTVQIVGSALLGLSVQCARCHSHKFEPLSDAEYYALQAIFWPAYHPETWRKPSERVLSVGTVAQRAAHAAAMTAIARQVEALEASLAGCAAPLRRELVLERIEALGEPAAGALRTAWEKAEADRSDEEKQRVADHAKLLAPSDEELGERFTEFAQLQQSVKARIAALRQGAPEPLAEIAVLTETCESPPPHHVRPRGQYRELGPEVAPGVPAALESDNGKYSVDPAAAGPYRSGRRLALARWLTSPTNPRLSRVTVNRVWQQHFGRGLVATSDQFGLAGSEPTHPELLDWLAAEFVASGWSMKHLHRLIVGSRTYRQSSAWRDEAAAVDPANHLLWRFDVRRLDAEALRDAALYVAGELDTALGGPYVPTARREDGAVIVAEETPGAQRRSIYLQQRRTQVVSLLDVFDAPLVVTNCTRRPTSTIPLQALALLNSEFMVRRGAAFARRLGTEAGFETPARIDRAFLLALGRGPSGDERAAAERFLEARGAVPAGPGDDAARNAAWSDFCQALLASNAFLYVE